MAAIRPIPGRPAAAWSVKPWPGRTKMSASAVVEQFTAAREQLDSACDLLRSPTPEVLDRCSVLLESAGRQMADCQSRIAEVRGDPVALEEAWRVRRSFVR